MYQTLIYLLFLWALVSPAQDAKPNSSAAQSHPDFPGTWKIPARQQNFPGGENRTDSRPRYSDFETDRIDHAEPVLAIKRMTKVVRTSGPNGTTEQTLVFEKFSAERGGIAIGDTIERVKYQWGEPEKTIEEGRQTILIYGDVDNVFIDGKMVDGAGGGPLRDKPPVYPDNIAIGQTRDQVVKVYGQPTKTTQRNGKEIDFYGSLAVAYSSGNLVYISATGQTKDEVLAVFGQPTRTVEWKRKEFGFYPFMTATYFNNKLLTIGPSSY